PKTQWTINAETARLQQQQSLDLQAAEARKREREKAAEAERKRLLAQHERDEKDRRKRERDVAKETERLRRIYGDQSGLAPLPVRTKDHSGRSGAQTAPLSQGPFPGPRKQSAPGGAGHRYPSHPVQAGRSNQQTLRPVASQTLAPQRQQGVSNVFPQSGGGATFGAGKSVSNLLGVGGGGGNEKDKGKGKLAKKRSSFW
ncbi:MAG: hypothetical protein Q9162_003312, partial [Coniocarpon cinnabarinum]